MCRTVVMFLGLASVLGATGAASAALVAHWPLNGDVRDVVGSNDGALVGGAEFVRDADRGTVLSVDGVNGHVLVPHGDDIAFIDERTVSITLWVKPASVPRTTWTTVLAKNRDIHYNNAYGIWISPENQWHFRFGAASGNANQPNAPAATAQWNHLAMTHDPATTTLRGYVDGVLVYQNVSASPGTLGNTALWIGGAGGVSEFYPGLLDDVRIYNHALTEAEIQEVMLSRTDSTLAGDPHPDDQATDVPRDVALSWTAGQYAATHDVYFGTSFADVNDAGRADPRGALVSQGQTATAYDPPGLLDFETVYYWRIDEVNAPPSNTIFKGNVWSFTTEPLAYSVQNIVATSNGISQPATGPDKTVDGSGLSADDRHSIDAADMWLADPPADGDLYIEYAFDRVYKLHEMLVWNYNVQFELVLGFGLKDVTIEYSADGAEWMVLDDVQFARGTARADYVANTVVDLQGVAAKFIRLTVKTGWGSMGQGQFGLSEVRFLFIPAHAREPQPADGAVDVSVDSTLAWRAGRDAVSHEVYFGTDPNALDLVATVEVAGYDPGALNLDATYYWQINAVQEAESWEGALWSFATQEHLVVDDFESYTDDIDAGEAIFDTWLDGWVNDTGSTVGHLQSPFAEQTIVRSGRQSMPLFYDNTEAAVSEADLELAADWTANGIQSLTLYFYGDPDNTGQLYVKINNTKVSYEGDPANIRRAAWQVWNIDLSAVGNVSNVRSLTIGIEGAGATGVVYIDDIRLYPHAPEFIVPAEPDTANLVAHYALDGNANDASGNGFHGTVQGDVIYVPGVDGQAVQLNGTDAYVSVAGVGITGAAPRTIAGWAKADTTGIPAWTNVFGFTGGSVDGQHFDIQAVGDTGTTTLGYYGLHRHGWEQDILPIDLEWHHLAATFDGTAVSWYGDGRPIGSVEVDNVDTPGEVRMGNRQDNDNFFPGSVDEVRIYDRALSDGEIAWLAGKTEPIHTPF